MFFSSSCQVGRACLFGRFCPLFCFLGMKTSILVVLLLYSHYWPRKLTRQAVGSPSDIKVMLDNGARPDLATFPFTLPLPFGFCLYLDSFLIGDFRDWWNVRMQRILHCYNSPLPFPLRGICVAGYIKAFGVI